MVSDCSRALDLNPKYAKALSRRAKSADHLGDLKLALEGILCLLFHIFFYYRYASVCYSVNVTIFSCVD